SDSPAKRTSAKLKNEELLLPDMGGVRLRMELDRYLWSDKDHVSVGQLAEWFSRYLYLPRIKDRDTLNRAVVDGATHLTFEDTFGVAAAWDEGKKRYIGLKLGAGPSPIIETRTLVVKPAVARKQIQAEKAADAAQTAPTPTEPRPTEAHAQPQVVKGPPAPPNLFIGSAHLDPARIGRDAGKIAEEVVQHLSTLPGAVVDIVLEIR